MRALFFLLLLANLLFYAWHAGYIGPGETHKGEGERLALQITPEKIRLLNAGEVRKLAEASKVRSNVCFEWGTFPAQEADKAGEALAALNLGSRLQTRAVEETAGWWVFLPPQGNKLAADKKLDELKALGVSDFFIVQEESVNKFAISLGVFRTEDAAKNYLATVSARGVKTARTGERETKVQKTVFRLSGLDDAAGTKFDAIRKDFPGHDTRDCAPAGAAADDGRTADKGAADRGAADRGAADKGAGDKGAALKADSAKGEAKK